MLIGMPRKQFDAPSSNSKHGHLVLGEIVGEMAFELGDLELSGYIPGVVGKITEAHGTYYYEHWGFDVTFETQVGRELSEFLINFHDRRDGFWVAWVSGAFAGSVAIDGSDAQGQGARLRWFIVAPQLQGRGIGRALLKNSIEFCRKAGHSRVILWTFEGLDAARCLYEEAGFRLAEEREVRQWGQNIREQMFELKLPALSG
jgi:GNAT superfamily N-acetyltransferase